MAILNLPDEIEMDILSRLPVESLLQFRCVSKPSRSLISDPHFVKLHHNRSILSKNFQKIVCSSYSPLTIDYESLLDNNDNDDNNNAIVKSDCPMWNKNSFLIGSCNGLLCYVVDRLNIILYNPSTRVSKELPKPPSSSTTPLPDPLICRGDGSRIYYYSHYYHYYYGGYYYGCYYGFAFDSSDDDYKVVLGIGIVDGKNSKSISFHIFSLRHNSWRRIQDLSWSHLGISPMWLEGIFLNGAFHWLIYGINPGIIVSFDLSKEVFSEMSLDDIQGKTNMLGVFEECLYAVSISTGGANGGAVEVWLMKEYGVKASWCKFVTFPFPCIVGPFLTPVCFLRNGELLLKINGENNCETKLASYNTKENTFTKIYICPYFSNVVLHVESLYSPNSFDCK